MSDTIFPKGFIFKLPADKAPDFVKGKISINVDEFYDWVKDNIEGDWVNIDLKIGKSGKEYAQLNTWKKDDKPETKPPKTNNAEKEQPELSEDNPDDLPF